MIFYLLRASLVVLCFAICHAQAQVPTFTSVRAAGGTRPNVGNAIAVDDAGDTYIAGSFGDQFGGTLNLTTTNLVSAGESDGFVAKFDAQGDCLWARQISGIEKDDAYGVVVRSDGSILISGEFVGTNSIGNTTLVSHGGYDIFFAAFDSAGDLLWARAVGGTLDDFSVALTPTSDGSAIFTGSFAGDIDLGGGISFSSPDDEALLMKLDAGGTVRWARSAGGPGFQLGSDIKVDGQGDIYWVGEFRTNITFGTTALASPHANVFLAKYSSAGTFLTVRKLGDGEFANLPRIALGPNGRVLCTAVYFGNYSIAGHALPSGQDDVLLVSFDSTDAVEWVNTFGGPELDVCTELMVDPHGAAYLSGHFRGTMTVGNTNLTSAGSTDIFVVRCSANGQFQGATKAGGRGPDLAFSAVLTRPGTIRLTGAFSGIAEFGSISVTSSDALPKAYFATMTVPPTLRITGFPTHVVVSWPDFYSNFILQHSSDLSPSSWNTVPITPSFVNGELVVTNQISLIPQFYRLRD